MATTTTAAPTSGSPNPEPVPAVVQEVVQDVLVTQYTTKDAGLQANIIEKRYTPDGEFVDPIMHVKHHPDIQLQFYSLIRIFESISVVPKGITVKPPQDLERLLKKSPQQFGTANVVAVVDNQQTYRFARSGLFGKALPKQIVLDVTTTLVINQQTGQVRYHEDVWQHKWVPIPKFSRKLNGATSCFMMRLLGWQKKISEAKKRS
jgi:hypothetical protein